MNDNKTDELFRSNSEYLASQPHPDFDAEAFWQQLRSELARPKRKKAIGWRWASAAVVVVALLAGGMWGWEPQPDPLRKVASKKAPVAQRQAAGNTPSLAELPAGPEMKENLPAPRIEVRKRWTKNDVRPGVPKEIPHAPEAMPVTLLLVDPQPISVAIPSSESPQPSVLESPGTKPEKKRYRVVHLNELRPQSQQPAPGRSQFAFRIGAPETAPPASPDETRVPLAIPIKN